MVAQDFFFVAADVFTRVFRHTSRNNSHGIPPDVKMNQTVRMHWKESQMVLMRKKEGDVPKMLM